MPQADLTAFAPTLLFLPLTFLGGYFFFVTHWVPRLMLTLKARDWLTTYAVGLVLPGGAWPELFLMTLQFAGLVLLLSKVTLEGIPPGLTPLAGVPPRGVTFALTGGARVENFFFLWSSRRGHFFFTPAGAALTGVVHRVLSGFSLGVPPGGFPVLGSRLRRRLSKMNTPLPGRGD